MTETEQERIKRTTGLDVETVGNIIEQGEGTPPTPKAFVLPRLGDYPHTFPEPGIYFGMPDEVYHGIPALSTGGVKKMAASPMIFWAGCPWMNPGWEAPEQKDHFDIGHAYHCRILEGREAFEERFAVGLDKADFPGVLVTDEDVKGAFPEGIKPGGKSKRERFERLRTFDATVQLWEDVVAEHAAANPGKCFITARTKRQLEIAAAMIEKDPELSAALAGGYPEVSLFWFCPRTGVPMKARADKLKAKMIVDLKTLQNTQEASIENAIRRDIANRRYAIQPSVYLEGAREVRKLVRERGAAATHLWGLAPGDEMTLEAQERDREVTAWALKWASHTGTDEFLFIYQQKGPAPVARGLFWPRGGTTMMLANDIVSMMKKRFRQFAETFGTDPWIDAKPIYDLADEDLPPWATEI